MPCATPAIPSVDARIAAASVPGFPIVTRRAMRLAGVNDSAIRRRLADGRLNELWSDTFVVGTHASSLPRDIVRMAAVVSAGSGAALHGPSALERFGAWTRHDGSIHVVSTRGHRDRPEFGVRFHRAKLPLATSQVLHVDGIPTTSALRAVIQAAPLLTAYQLAHVIKRAEYLRLITLDEVEVEAEQARSLRARGSRALREAVELRRGGSAGTRGRTEDELHPHLVERFGQPVVNVLGAAGIPGYEPDFAWPERRWIVEVDGDHHVDDPLQAEQDRERDALLRARGWIVVRIPYRDVWRDLPLVLTQIEVAFHGSATPRAR